MTSARFPSRSAIRRTAIAMVGVGTLVVLAACSGTSGTSASPSARSQTLVIAENEPPATFDPIQADNSTVDEVDLPAYDTILQYSGTKLEGNVATAFSTSSDGKTVSLTIRSGITFHDGAKLTATDVKYTLDRIKKINIDIASLLSSYASSTVVDPTHLTIQLSSPDATFLPALSKVYVVNSALVTKHAGSDDGQKWLSTHDAGSGPYEVTGYTPNQKATFSQYPKYWKGFDGQAKKVEFDYLSDASTEETALRSGDVDIAMDVAPSDWASFKSNPDYIVNTSATNVVLYVFFNMENPTTKNKALREAIAYSYNYGQHVSSILKGAGQKVTGVLPAGMECSSTSIPQPTYDPAKAKQIVQANHLAGTTVTMTYLKATDEMEQAAALLQSNMKDVGLNLKIDAITFPQYQQMYAKASTRPQLGMIYAFPSYPDASAILYQNFDSKFIGSGINYGGYDNPQVDKLVQAAQTESDATTRCQQYTQAQDIIAGDYATINMANSKTVAVMSSRVKDFTYQATHHQTVDVYAIKLK